MSASAYVGICIVIAGCQRSLMYFPDRQPLARQQLVAGSVGLEEWQAADGSLMGWRTPPGDERSCWVVFHGNAGLALDRAHFVGMVRQVDPQAAVFLFEYPGYGARQGEISQESLVTAASAAVSALPADARIHLVGESLGSGVACAVAGAEPKRIAGLLLITPFNSMLDVASYHYPWLPVSLLLSDRYLSEQALISYPGPLAVVVAADDDVIPPAFGERLYTGFGGTKKLWKVPGAGHNTIMGIAGWWAPAARFVSAREAPITNP